MTPDLRSVTTLTEDQADQVRRLVSQSAGAQDNPPISEGGLLRLHAGAPVRHLLATSEGSELLGYAQLAPDAEATAAELVAVDDAVALELLGALEKLDAEDPHGELRLWAHGESSVARRAAQQAGLLVTRELLQLRRSLPDLELGDVPRPAGVNIRPFVPGRDDQAWLALNALAFASHPEQGGWTQRDLDERLQEPWFDPGGFLLAERDGELVGYHWTKVHDETPEPMGEVYVLGVHPAAQGMHLGRVLLTAGLRHLRGLGLGTVLLYVDETNTGAVALYRTLGFAEFSRDVQYVRP